MKDNMCKLLIYEVPQSTVTLISKLNVLFLTESISGSSGSMDDVCQLLFLEDDDSNFGTPGLHRHTVHL